MTPFRGTDLFCLAVVLSWQICFAEITVDKIHEESNPLLFPLQSMATEGNLLYVAAGAGGFFVIDLAVASFPVVSQNSDGYSVNDIAVSGVSNSTDG